MPEAKKITLYAAIDSPFPHRVLLALEEAHAKYDTIWIELVNKPEWYEKKVNPAGKVPFLVYGDPKLHADEEVPSSAVKIPESLVILEFIADLFPEAHLLPADPALRAAARLFYLAVDTKLLKVFFPFVFLDAPAEGVFAVLDEFQAMLPPTGYAVGEWSIADAAFMPILIRFYWFLKEDVGNLKPGVAKAALETFESPRFARLRKYIEDNMQRPSMVNTWNAAIAKEKFLLRLERFRKTGIINSDIRIPLPSVAE